jgi:hypothetical protein
MDMYDVEALNVKQRKILQEIYEYVSGAALGKDLYSVGKENDRLKKLAVYSHLLLSQSITIARTYRSSIQFITTVMSRAPVNMIYLAWLDFSATLLSLGTYL